ncbi:MAG: adenylate/guanylate cyclase domain-containing protein [Candidatus Accumulibacter sp.]|jgi:class 3 adenylate cyclase|nr:adenylate/guanylate cyclase domain-containing protein [Accumulibacter sp.]
MADKLGFIEHLRNAGIAPEDSEELRLNKSLMVFATGLFCFVSVVWLIIYWQFEPHFSVTLPLLFQVLLTANLLIYMKTRNFDIFCRIQLSFFLFFPFIVQWGIGDFASASGISLMGFLAPIGALLVVGTREALAWFFAYIILTALSGVSDYYLADTPFIAFDRASLKTSIFFFVLNFIAISAIIFSLLRHSVVEELKTKERLQEARRRIQLERDRSEHLLLNTLPRPIAARLKGGSQTIADGFTDVSVMFVDIVNFTRLAGNLTPQEVFSMLNRIFSSFDDLAERYGMEKIKTIGDAYMVAGGLNSLREDHTAALVDLAIAMRALLENNDKVNDMHLKVRIGIGTGPVVAGVVGKKKFIYDLWGDTVNIASRLTSESEPDMIQVDETTYEHLSDRFEFEGPQTHFLKGKGNTLVYRVIGRRPRAKE